MWKPRRSGDEKSDRWIGLAEGYGVFIPKVELLVDLLNCQPFVQFTTYD
jgi:hypothetical protein